MGEQTHGEISSETHSTEAMPMGNLPIKRAQDFVRVYGSVVAASSSPWDISFTLGQPIIDDPESIHIEQRVAVTMSWQAAKALAQILASNVRNYESQFGPMRLTPLQTQSDQPASE